MRPLKVALAVLIAMSSAAALPDQTVANHHVVDWESSSESTGYGCCYTRVLTGDSFRMIASMSWSAYKAGQMRTNRSRGIYFTFDQNDLSHNVDAYSIATNFPNPYRDFDDDNGNQKKEEAEVVSESTTFPTAGTAYSVSVYWSRSWWNNFYPHAWGYDGDGGTVEFVENLSALSCWGCDKYDTHCCNANLGMNRTYPAKARPASAAATEPVSETTADDGGTVTMSGVPEGRHYHATTGGGGPNDIHLHADLGRGHGDYARRAAGLAIAEARRGNAEGVITFARPVSWGEIEALAAMGLVVHDVEFVSEPDSTGSRWTFFLPNEPTAPENAASFAEEAEVDILGIVSATATVRDATVLNTISASGLVYLVDLSIAHFKRHNPGVDDVSQNDVYWEVAGWE